MSELAVRPVSDLSHFVEEARQVHAIATALADTAFVPAAMKGKPQEITGAILFGRELGLDPMTSLQTINLIQGRPTLTANAMRGLAMAAGVRFRLDETTQTRCVMSALAPGSDKWTTVTWTLDQARSLNLLTKDNWKNQPGVMLIARATSQLCRLVAANILIGAPYSYEEIRDLPAEPEQAKPLPRVKPVQQPHKYAEPELTPDNQTPSFAKNEEPQKEIVGYSQHDDEKRNDPEPPADREGKITAKTRAAVMAAFNDAGVKDRNVRNEILTKILGRDVPTVNNITEGEAQSVLGVLALDPQWPAAAQVPGQS